MKVVKTIPAGRPGTRRYLAEWGDKLLNVRYRVDDVVGITYTTVEIVVDERTRIPLGRTQNYYLRARDKAWVSFHLGPWEKRLIQKVRELGGAWDEHRQLWRLSRGKVVSLGLLERIVE